MDRPLVTAGFGLLLVAVAVAMAFVSDGTLQAGDAALADAGAA
jgi:hypothetical protein